MQICNKDKASEHFLTAHTRKYVTEKKRSLTLYCKAYAF